MPEAARNDAPSLPAAQRSAPSQQNEISREDAGEGAVEHHDMRVEEREQEAPVRCCVREGWGVKLSPWVVLVVFVYCNMLNYIDRGLVNGVLPKYCVNCPDRQLETACNASRLQLISPTSLPPHPPRMQRRTCSSAALLWRPIVSRDWQQPRPEQVGAPPFADCAVCDGFSGRAHGRRGTERAGSTRT